MCETNKLLGWLSVIDPLPRRRTYIDDVGNENKNGRFFNSVPKIPSNKTRETMEPTVANVKVRQKKAQKM